MAIKMSMRFSRWDDFRRIRDALEPLGLRARGAIREQTFYKSVRFEADELTPTSNSNEINSTTTQEPTIDHLERRYD